MSASYSLHVSPFAVPGDVRALERADLVRDGFSWGAFLVPMLWFFRHRHWVLGLAALVVVAALWVGLRAAGAGFGTALLAEILLHLLIGLEGASLRRWAYERSGRPVVDVVFAASEAEAETKSFARWLAPPAPAPARPEPTRAGPWIPRREPGVIGLFPDLEGRP